MTHIVNSRRRRQTGFSLVEVLVALVVISIGMIGIASMQVQGLQFSQQAITSTRAINLATDIADRIRANSRAQRPGTAAAATGPGDAYHVDNAAAGDPPTVCADSDGADMNDASRCTALALADFDLWQWKTALAGGNGYGNGLPNGKGSVDYTIDAAGINQFSIVVSWDDRGEPRSYEVVVRQ